MKKKYEDGHVLLIVLLLIMVFSILSVSLISVNTSASKQFDKKEEQVKARHIAEMGVIHYKAELNKRIETHVANIKSMSKREDIDKENEKLCDYLKGSVSAVNTEKSKYHITNNNTGCSQKEDNIYINITSKGETEKGTVSSIGYDLVIDRTLKLSEGGSGTNPGDSSAQPTLPTPPTSFNTKWPCQKGNGNGNIKCDTHPITQYTDVSGSSGIDTVYAGNVNLSFEDSLVIGKLIGRGGKEFNMTVQKDLFIKGDLTLQNHACIMVRGNFSLKGNFSSNAQTKIYVYGNASLVNFNGKKNVELFVSGTTYINNMISTSINKVPDGKNCGIPVSPPTLPNTPVDPKELEVEIVKEKFIY